MPIIIVSIGADIDKDQEGRNSHGARKKKEKEELDAPGRNFRPGWPELPPHRNFRPQGPELPPRCRQDAFQRPEKWIRPELPPRGTGTSAHSELPPKFRPSSEITPKCPWMLLQGNGPYSELGRNLTGTSGPAGTSAPQDRNFRPGTGTSAPQDRNFRHRELQHSSTFQRVTYPFAPTYK
jgi:hypothetical protein